MIAVAGILRRVLLGAHHDTLRMTISSPTATQPRRFSGHVMLFNVRMWIHRHNLCRDALRRHQLRTNLCQRWLNLFIDETCVSLSAGTAQCFALQVEDEQERQRNLKEENTNLINGKVRHWHDLQTWWSEQKSWLSLLRNKGGKTVFSHKELFPELDQPKFHRSF